MIILERTKRDIASLYLKATKYPEVFNTDLKIRPNVFFESGSSETSCCIVALRRIGRFLANSVHQSRSLFSP